MLNERKRKKEREREREIQWLTESKYETHLVNSNGGVPLQEAMR